MLAGTFQARNRFRVSNHAPTEEVAAVGDAVSQYPATKGITSTQVLALVREHRGAIRDEIERLPGRLRAREGLPDVAAAYDAAHFSDHEGGRARLAFDELLLDQLVQLRLRDERRSEATADPLVDPPSLSRIWREEQLPFTPTGDQLTAMAEIDADLAQERPMQRLLMGEVGSGNVHAMLRAVEHGRQAALMAPTETLAEQHFATLQALMPGGLVTAAAADRLDARRPPPRDPRPAGHRRALDRRRHPRADRGQRRLLGARAGRQSTSSTASVCASGPPWTRRRRRGLRRTCCNMTAGDARSRARCAWRRSARWTSPRSASCRRGRRPIATQRRHRRARPGACL